MLTIHAPGLGPSPSLPWSQSALTFGAGVAPCCCLMDALPLWHQPKARHLSRWPAALDLSVSLRPCQPRAASCPGIWGAKGRTSVILLTPQRSWLRSQVWLAQPTRAKRWSPRCT